MSTEHGKGDHHKVGKWRNFQLYNLNSPVNNQETTDTNSAECMNNETMFEKQYDQS